MGLWPCTCRVTLVSDSETASCQPVTAQQPHVGKLPWPSPALGNPGISHKHRPSPIKLSEVGFMGLVQPHRETAAGRGKLHFTSLQRAVPTPAPSLTHLLPSATTREHPLCWWPADRGQARLRLRGHPALQTMWDVDYSPG